MNSVFLLVAAITFAVLLASGRRIRQRGKSSKTARTAACKLHREALLKAKLTKLLSSMESLEKIESIAARQEFLQAKCLTKDLLTQFGTFSEAELETVESLIRQAETCLEAIGEQERL